LVNILCIVQGGRLQYEALLFMASFRKFHDDTKFKVFMAEPQPGDLWDFDPRVTDGPTRDMLESLGAEIIPLHSKTFGSAYPNGNKIEALALLPEGEPFIFFDTDTLFTGPLDKIRFNFDKPSASSKCEGTWPQPDLYGPGYGDIWKSLYDKFGLDFESALDMGQPDEYWQRYLYFNAGFFYYKCPKIFGEKFLEYATAIRDNPPAELDGQALYPWLDQIALPLVIHALGGGKGLQPTRSLDGPATCHYRVLSLLYAREPQRVIDVLEEVCAPNKIKKLLKGSEAFKRLVYQGRGHKLRAIITPDDVMKPEQKLRQKIKNRGFWIR